MYNKVDNCSIYSLPSQFKSWIPVHITGLFFSREAKTTPSVDIAAAAVYSAAQLLAPPLCCGP